MCLRVLGGDRQSERFVTHSLFPCLSSVLALEKSRILIFISFTSRFCGIKKLRKQEVASQELELHMEDWWLLQVWVLELGRVQSNVFSFEISLIFMSMHLHISPTHLNLSSFPELLFKNC